MRDLLNFKIEVYVEGEGETKDSDFYEAVYVILSSYSDKYLRNNQNEKDKFLIENNLTKLLSRRFKLYFHTATSCKEVINYPNL